MNTLFCLIKRNLLMYFRDRSAVFFSLLSMIIVIGLMVLFLGNMNKDNVIDLLQQYGGQRDVDLDSKNATYLIQVWTIAGLLVVNSLTVSLTMIGYMVEDEARKRLGSFYVAPVKRSVIAIGYVAASIIVASIICIFTLLIAQGYLFFSGEILFSVEQIIKIIGLIVINVFVYSSILFLVAVFVHSISAWSALGSIVSTLVGFVGAIYLPMGMLPNSVQTILKYIPILHGVSLFRKVCTEVALANTFTGIPIEVKEGYQRYMSITVDFDGNLVSAGTQLIFLILCGVITLIISSILMKQRALKDC